MQVNDLGFIASILFVLVPTVFLLVLYIQTASREGNKNTQNLNQYNPQSLVWSKTGVFCIGQCAAAPVFTEFLAQAD